MRANRKVHVHSEEPDHIPVVRSPPHIRTPSISKFKILLIVTLILVIVITIVVTITLSRGKTTSNTFSGTTLISNLTTIVIELTSTKSPMPWNQSITSIPSSTIDPSISSTDAATILKTATITAMIPTNLIRNPGAEAQLDDWTQMGDSSVIIDSNGTFNKGYYPHSGTYCFAGGHGNNGWSSKLTQRTVLRNGIHGIVEDQIDSGQLKVYISFYYQTRHDLNRTDDTVIVDLIFRAASGDITGGLRTDELTCRISNLGWCLYTNSSLLPASTRMIYYAMLFYKNDEIDTNINAYIDDNSLIIM